MNDDRNIVAMEIASQSLRGLGSILGIVLQVLTIRKRRVRDALELSLRVRS